MSIVTMGTRTAEFLLSEAGGQRSREEITLAVTATALPAGQVLGKVTATGHYVPYDDALEDGGETAAAVLYEAKEASDAVQQAGAVVRDAELIGSKLTGLDAAGATDLAAVGLIVR